MQQRVQRARGWVGDRGFLSVLYAISEAAAAARDFYWPDGQATVWHPVRDANANVIVGNQIYYIFAFAMLSSAGLPLLNGFVGEFTILQGAFEANRIEVDL